MKQVYLFLFLCVTCYVKAQSPDLINYQGAMRGATGLPMAGRNIQVHFELRQGSATSGAVYQENQPLSTNLLGLFATQIGKMNPGAFALINWAGGPLFLSVSVDTTGGTNFTELGVQQLVSVPYAMYARTAERVATSFSANVLTIAGQSYSLSPSSASFGGGAGIAISGSVITNSAPDQTVSIAPSGSNVQVMGAYPNFSIASTPSLTFNSNGQLGITDGNAVNITQSVSIQNNILTVGAPSNTVSLPGSITPSMVGQGAADVNPPSGYNFTVTVPPTSVSISNSVGAAASTTSGVNNFNINIPAPQFNPATGALTTGTVVNNITPLVTLNSGVLTVGPSTNNVTIPTTPATTLNATGAATLNPNGPTYNLHVIPASIAVTTNVAAAGATSLAPNSFSINIPPPQYNAATGILTTGTSTTNVTPTLGLSSGVLTVGPPTNTIPIPSTPATTLTATGAATLNPSGPGYSLHVIPASVAVTTNVAAAGVTSVAPNNFSINIPPPQYNAVTGILTTGNATTNVTPTLGFSSGILTVGPSTNNISIPSTPATTLIATGAATLNPSGPGYSLHVIPASVAVTTNVAAAGVTSVAPNNFSINIPPPVYNPATGVLSTGTSTTHIAPALNIVGNILTVGPATNAIAVPVPTVAGQGLATVTPSVGMNFTVTVPVPSYNGTTGVLTSGTVNTNVVPVINFSNNVLTVGPGTNSTNLSALSPWTANGGSVVLSTGTNYVGIGTNSPSEMLEVGSYSLAQSNYIAVKTAGSNSFKAGIKLNHFNNNDGFTIESDETVNQLNIIRHGTTSNTVMSFDRLTDRVGIGTTAPSATLHVAGTFRLQDGTEATNRVLTSDAIGNATWHDVSPAWSYTGNAGTNAATNFIGTTDGVPLSFRTNSLTRMYIDAVGSVGIGTTSPAGKLHVEAANGRYEVLDVASSGGSILLGSYNGNSGLGPQTRYSIDGSAGFADIGLNSTADFVIEMNNTPQISVAKANGYVGVGTSTAGTQLEVNGDISIPSTGKVVFGTNGSGIGEWMSNVTSGLGFFTSSVHRMQVDNSGYVGIGNTSPTVKLDVGGTETQTSQNAFAASPGTSIRIFNFDNSTTNNFSSLIFGTIASNNASYESAKIVAQNVSHTSGSIQGDLVFLTRRPANLIEGMRLTGTGRVGIATSAPTATLHVNGTTRLTDGSEGTGKVLTSDAVGNASWQAFGGSTAGMVMAFAGPTANIPTGWVECDGSALSRTTYSVLFSAIGTSWGIGNGSTTFNIPDMRGMFLRGVNGGAANDPNASTRLATNSGNSGNAVGSSQDDSFESHTHTITNHGSTLLYSQILGGTPAYEPGGTTTSNATGGNETRPKNVYVYYIIKL